ncbi:centrosomal protein 43-like [Xenia sp. Carnegie-2017]|uniref:centrosomal protein 43-like n=1 Tax=Xenia sp. Carnegie-2017 TaxID=2897299 RepID=UPI001F03AA85|nr:centrosomal protein 43-like [Xenia sp. Carnegie-2017]
MNGSFEEDADLRDLVAHALESKGILGKIKAELRANVFMVLDELDKNDMNRPQYFNEKLKNFMTTKEGKLITGLVREFLEFFNLDYTLAVFDPESNFGNQYKGRDSLVEELDFQETVNESKPIISFLLEDRANVAMAKPNLTSVAEDVAKNSHINSPDMSPRSVSSSGKNNSSRVSRIPQRVKDIKKMTETLNTKSSKDASERSHGEDRKSIGNKTGISDLSVSLNDDDILAEFTNSQPQKSSKDLHQNERKQGVFFDEDLNAAASFEESWLHDGKTSLPKLKKQSLTSGLHDVRDMSSNSADLKELEDIDRKIHELGFGLPAKDKSSDQGEGENNDSYAEDFHTSTHSNEDNSSIPEEIDQEIQSLESFKSDRSKMDEPHTSDRTISPVSDDFKDFDYGEAVHF